MNDSEGRPTDVTPQAAEPIELWLCWAEFDNVRILPATEATHAIRIVYESSP